jgi:7-carboxy-7-deazaguanine synthase (Cx14CxxC type)
MTYAVKEVFYTLQGEGARTGRPAVFCRFSRCNLWSGHERDRAAAICRFCDTDFVGTDGEGGGLFPDHTALAEHVHARWPGGGEPYVVCTGGEPLLQLDAALVESFHRFGFEVAIETNGTLAVPRGVDWVCMSPKAGTEVVVTTGDELKLIHPQEDAEPERFESFDFDHFFLQPMDGPARERNTHVTVQYCLDHPRWRLSLQTHKLLGIP